MSQLVSKTFILVGTEEQLRHWTMDMDRLGWRIERNQNRPFEFIARPVFTIRKAPNCKCSIETVSQDKKV